MDVRVIFPVLCCLLAISLSAAAPAQNYGGPGQSQSAAGYSGYSGGEKTPTPQNPVENPPAAAPAVTAPAAAAPLPATNDSTQKITDPCASYMYAYDAYTLCHDRLIKIQRMKDAKGKRAAKQEAKTPAAAPAPAGTAHDTAEGTAEGTAPENAATKEPAAEKMEEALKQAQ